MKWENDELTRRVQWLLIGLTVAVYWRVSSNGFVNYDDQAFVSSNSPVYSGLSIANTIWAFTTVNGGISSYHPLTWLTHQLDCQIFGLKAGPQHLTNLWFHVSNVALLFALLEKATGKLWRSAMVAALFAVHPLHVETVAWISERKTLVCTFFWLLTALRYIRYTREGGVLNYVLVLVLYTAALLSKPIAVSLPITLLLFDYWPLERFRLLQNGRQIILEKIPMFLLSGVFCWVTVVAQDDLGAIQSLVDAPIGVRLKNSIVACVMYLRKMLWPSDLAPIYLLRHDWAWWQVAGCGFFLSFASLFVILQVRKRPYMLVGWVWYLTTLFPTIGLVQVGLQGMADRYSYVPLIGIFVLVVWSESQEMPAAVGAEGASQASTQAFFARNSPFVSTFFRKNKGDHQKSIGSECVIAFDKAQPRCHRSPQSLTWFANIAVLVALAVSTFITLDYWRDSFHLFQHAVRVTQGNYIAHCQLGGALFYAGKLQEAEREFRESLRLKPDQIVAEKSLGRTLFLQGDDKGALEHYSRAIRLSPADAQARGMLAELLLLSKDPKISNPKLAQEQGRLACRLTSYENRQLLQEFTRICTETFDFQEAKDVAQKLLPLCVLPEDIEQTHQLMLEIRRMEEKAEERSGAGNVRMIGK